MAYHDPKIPDKALNLTEENDYHPKLQGTNLNPTEEALNWEDPSDIGSFPEIMEHTGYHK